MLLIDIYKRLTKISLSLPPTVRYVRGTSARMVHSCRFGEHGHTIVRRVTVGHKDGSKYILFGRFRFVPQGHIFGALVGGEGGHFVFEVLSSPDMVFFDYESTRQLNYCNLATLRMRRDTDEREGAEVKAVLSVQLLLAEDNGG